MSPKLDWVQLRGFDSRFSECGEEERYCCPLPDCAGKPLDREHQSLSVNKTTGLWICHRCRTSGMLTDFWIHRYTSQKRGIRQNPNFVLSKGIESKPPIISELTSNAVTIAPTYSVEPSAEPNMFTLEEGGVYIEGFTTTGVRSTDAERFLLQRGFSSQYIRSLADIVEFSPDWYGRAAIVVRLQNQSGVVVAWQGRHLDNKEIKSRSRGPVKEGVFRTPGALKSDPFVICEAPLDALSLHQVGLPSIALCGTAGRDWLANELAWKRVALAFDTDDAGDVAAQRWGSMLAPYGAKVLRFRPEGAKDWNEILMQSHESLKQQVDALRKKLGQLP